ARDDRAEHPARRVEAEDHAHLGFAAVTDRLEVHRARGVDVAARQRLPSDQPVLDLVDDLRGPLERLSDRPAEDPGRGPARRGSHPLDVADHATHRAEVAPEAEELGRRLADDDRALDADPAAGTERRWRSRVTTLRHARPPPARSG